MIAVKKGPVVLPSSQEYNGQCKCGSFIFNIFVRPTQDGGAVLSSMVCTGCGAIKTFNDNGELLQKGEVVEIG